MEGGSDADLQTLEEQEEGEEEEGEEKTDLAKDGKSRLLATCSLLSCHVI